MRARAVGAPAAVVAVLAGTLVPAGGAHAAERAPTTVTIVADGTDMSGRVVSPRPNKCAAGRKVIVVKQVGSRGGGNDEKFATDTAGKQGDDYVWSTGNTGTEGKFYAKVKRTPDCKRDASPTIDVNQPM